MLACSAVAALAGLVGCGGDADPTSPPQDTEISHARYVDRADRLCATTRRRSRARILPLVRRLARDGLSIADAMRVNRVGADAVRPTIRRIEALPRPDARRREIEAYIAASRRTLAALDEAIAAPARGDRAGLAEALARNRRGGPEIARAAKRAGFEECGSEFGASGLGSR